MYRWIEEFKVLKPHYSPIVNMFLKYLKEVDKMDKVGAVTESDIATFLKFSAKDGVNSRGTLALYYEGLKGFYNYLLINNYVQYSIFSGIVNHKEYKKQISNDLHLREEVSRGALSLLELELLLDKVNEYFELTDYSKLKLKSEQENYIKFLILRIYIKITVLAPAKRAVICNLKYSDFDSDFRVVTVNNQNIAIPRNLTSEIRNSLRFVQELMGKNIIGANERLFDYILDEPFNDNKISHILSTFSRKMDLDFILGEGEEKGKYSASGEKIMNGAICSLWDDGEVDVVMLSKVCGVSVQAISKKILDWSFDDGIARSRLNKQLKQVSYYNLL